MDGGGRLLQSLKTIARLGRDSAQAKAAQAAARPGQPKRAPRRRMSPRGAWHRFATVVTQRGFGTALVICLATATAVYGAVQSGAYNKFVEENGSARDILARAAGFGIDAITISGQRELLSSEVLKAANIRPQDSLMFLDVQQVRESLVKVPIIQAANVRKLYPNQLIVTVIERKAHAVWQEDGDVSIIAADGQVIDRMRDQRYTRLPFVVGKGANKRLDEYLKLLEAAGSLRSSIRAGTLIGERRWTIKFTNGLDLKLPEDDAVATMRQFSKLAAEHALMEKDLLVVDMRVPGRLIGTMSAEALEKREAVKSNKPKRKGGNA